jgi:hypothetical protein
MDNIDILIARLEEKQEAEVRKLKDEIKLMIKSASKGKKAEVETKVRLVIK